MDACAEQAAKQSAAQHFTRVAKRLVLVVIFIPLPCFAVFLQLETDNIRHTPHSASAWVGTQSCNDIPMMGLTLRERDSVSGIGAQPQRSRGVHSVHRKPELESLSFGQCCRKSARSPCVAPVHGEFIIMRRWASGTTLDNASASGRNPKPGVAQIR